MTQTAHLTTDTRGIEKAAALLSEGALVAFPTETVYGLGADARNNDAVAAVFAAKGRPSFNPLIVHVADLGMAQHYAEFSDSARDLAQAFWPGPLSMVLPLRANTTLSPLVTAGLDSVAIRVPAQRTAAQLLSAFGRPVAAPSANPSGQISPTRAEHVLAGLAGRIAAVLDDGPCALGLESTIVGLSGPDPVLLRDGGLPRRALEAALGRPLILSGTPDQITAPGQLPSHYAPRGPVRLNAPTAEPGERHLGFGSIAGDLSLSASGDLTEAAARLFDCLHQLNDSARPIAVAPIPERGLGRAINDRLRRAAAAR